LTRSQGSPSPPKKVFTSLICHHLTIFHCFICLKVTICHGQWKKMKKTFSLFQCNLNWCLNILCLPIYDFCNNTMYSFVAKRILRFIKIDLHPSNITFMIISKLLDWIIEYTQSNHLNHYNNGKNCTYTLSTFSSSILILWHAISSRLT